FASAFDFALFVNLFARILAVNLHHLSSHSPALAIPQTDAVKSERQFGFAGEFARFIDFGDVAFDGRVGVISRREHCGPEPIAVSRFFTVDLVLQPDLYFGPARDRQKARSGSLRRRSPPVLGLRGWN